MLGDLLTGPVVLQGGAGALLVLVALMVFTGRLVPRSVLEDVRADRRERVAEARREADEWREAHAAVVTATGDLAGQVQELLQHARTTGAVLTALRREGVS